MALSKRQLEVIRNFAKKQVEAGDFRKLKRLSPKQPEKKKQPESKPANPKP